MIVSFIFMKKLYNNIINLYLISNKQSIGNLYCTANNMTFFPDPRTNEWPMVQGITTPLACALVYLYLVLYLGPKFMENRKPFHLLPIIKVYNLVQLAACILIFYLVSIIFNNLHLL